VARQVDSLSGGGIINAMTAGESAGKAAAGALEDTSAAGLSTYSALCLSVKWRHWECNYRLRRGTEPRLVRARIPCYSSHWLPTERDPKSDDERTDY
jgi:flavin-dependent dehydrogenase